MPLGYRGHADWRDMSEYVVHFTRDTQRMSAYDAQISILSSCEIITRSSFGAARKINALGNTQRSACFSEVPLDRLDRLVKRRSSYGIGFSQGVLLGAGGGRVWYVDDSSNTANWLRQLMDQYTRPHVEVGSPLWKLTPFIDFPGTYGDTDYRFEWEREWRVPGGLSFLAEEVAFLFMPESLHSQARAFFDEAERTNTGPGYQVPFMDPLWPDDWIQQALAGI